VDRQEKLQEMNQPNEKKAAIISEDLTKFDTCTDLEDKDPA